MRDESVMGLVVAALVGALALVAAAAAAMALGPHHLIPFTFDKAVEALWRGPRRELGVGQLAAVVYYAVFGAIVISSLALALWLTGQRGAGRVRRRNPLSQEGLASRREIARSAGARPLVARSTILRPSLDKARPEDLGLFLGRARGVPCYLSVEDSMVTIGPPRVGKGMNLVIPMVLDAPGPVVETATRPDTLATTIATRRAVGDVAVFDPQGLARGVAGGLKWSPIRGCEDALIATARASALTTQISAGVTDNEFWEASAQRVVRNLLHAAALDGRPTSQLYRWASDARSARQAVTILETNAHAVSGWAEDLGSVVNGDDRMRGNVWAMVSNVFAALAVPEVCAQFSPDDAEEAFDPERFLRGRNTLYLLGRSSGAVVTSRFIAAFIEDIVSTAYVLASQSAGARLDPPLALVLDEAANFPLPSITGLMSEGGGSGIVTAAFFQSMSQARERWGKDQADAIWETATMKMILGGGGSAADLGDLAKLIGEAEVLETTTTQQFGTAFGSTGSRSQSQTMRERLIFDVPRLRGIPRGYGVLLARQARPMLTTLTPWTKRKDGKTLNEQRVEVEEQLRSTALARDTTGASA